MLELLEEVVNKAVVKVFSTKVEVTSGSLTTKIPSDPPKWFKVKHRRNASFRPFLELTRIRIVFVFNPNPTNPGPVFSCSPSYLVFFLCLLHVSDSHSFSSYSSGRDSLPVI